MQFVVFTETDGAQLLSLSASAANNSPGSKADGEFYSTQKYLRGPDRMFIEASLSKVSYQEIAASLFQPDPLIVDQHSDTFRRKLYLQPEKRLMLAVLEDAIFCFKKFMTARDRRRKALFHDAEDWIFCKNDDYAFSFVTI